MFWTKVGEKTLWNQSSNINSRFLEVFNQISSNCSTRIPSSRNKMETYNLIFKGGGGALHYLDPAEYVPPYRVWYLWS